MLYVYNGTFEGFLSAVSELLRNGPAIEDSVCKEADILPLLPSLRVETEEGITVRFGEYLKKHFGPNMPETVYRAFLSDFPGIEGSIIKYIQLARKLHRDPIGMLHVECVRHTHEAYKRTTGESHSYKGLLRFRSLSSDGKEILYAEFEPQTNCIGLVGEHFASRLGNIPFLIADRRRSNCLVHIPGDPWTVVKADPHLFERISSDTLYEELWRRYFKSLAIPERLNPELQRSNMPKKYWKYLVEDPGK